jgi:adenosylhomocysteine nucleosidase
MGPAIPGAPVVWCIAVLKAVPLTVLCAVRRLSGRLWFGVFLEGRCMLALFGALEQEISGFRKLMFIEKIDVWDDTRVYRGSFHEKKVLLVNSGVGKRRALAACRSVLAHYPVNGIISLGFAGGLKPGCRTGDMFVCSSLVCADAPAGLRFQTDPHLLSHARNCTRLAISFGIGVTSGRLVSSPLAKRALRDVSAADIVDMESYWLAGLAGESGIPFITGRAVSDSQTDTIPDLPSYRWDKAFSYFVWHPLQAWHLYRGINKACKSLTDFAVHMVEVTD